jgi:leucyl/phenylalanyl-tRNA---protein transferase
MPIFRLTEKIIFPDPELADREGILAVGGDLSPERLALAYCNGIFPWYTEGEPIIWWSPDPRFILYPKDIKISKSMGKLLKKNKYKVTFDTAFRDVITQCALYRSDGTWITNEMLEAYCKLHELGLAHSVETWCGEELAGGLYGVSIGACFFGESMFSRMDNASKTALAVLSGKLSERGFVMIDCQVYTKHLESLGAVRIQRKEFLKLLKTGLTSKTLQGKWTAF